MTDPVALDPARRPFVDLHHHAGVDTLRRRRTVIETGEAYAAIGAWVVVKSHLVPTTAAAWEARARGLPVSGSVVLNHGVGGLDPRVVVTAVLAHGPDAPARTVVYLPTVTGHAHPAGGGQRPFHPDVAAHAAGVAVSDDDGHLRRETLEVIACCADLPVVLATGHSTREEVLRVIDAAVARGVSRLVVTHATHPMVGLTDTDLRDLADVEGLAIELTGLTYILGRQRPEQFFDSVRAHPRVLLSSDLGQPTTVDVVDWLPWTREWMRAGGLGDDAVRSLLVTTPAELLAP
ncbi:DUF6282 family protein [Williamsia sp. Leaf354]|uniref:DUF6282 family protein n=1 Tax=Williamsia sp. Leaf354 TaxID=1736349 RepID=UPI0012E384E2|nr:DUF6282 family protein [Williamsia sp. Leaf354]